MKAVRIFDGMMCSDWDLSADRTLLVHDAPTPPAWVARTEAEATLLSIAAAYHGRKDNMSETAFRAMRREIPDWAPFADAEIPPPRPPCVTPGEAEALVDAGLAEWVEVDLDSQLDRLLV